VLDELDVFLMLRALRTFFIDVHIDLILLLGHAAHDRVFSHFSISILLTRRRFRWRIASMEQNVPLRLIPIIGYAMRIYLMIDQDPIGMLEMERLDEEGHGCRR